MVDALNALGFGFGFGERGEEHAGENRDDRDDDEQFDEREAVTATRDWHWVLRTHGYVGSGVRRHGSCRGRRVQR